MSGVFGFHDFSPCTLTPNAFGLRDSFEYFDIESVEATSLLRVYTISIFIFSVIKLSTEDAGRKIFHSTEGRLIK